MEAKLKEYRALRRRKELLDNAKEKIENTKEKLKSTKDKLVHLLVPKIFTDMGKEKDEEILLIENEEAEPVYKPPLLQPDEISEVASEVSEMESYIEESKESWQYFITKWTVYTIIWTSLYIYFLSLQFGAVFFAFSALLGIYLNTRTRPKKKGEVSAYSVFNQDCQSINGTLKAEDLQRQMLYGLGGIRPI